MNNLENISVEDLAKELINRLNTLCGSKEVGQEFIKEIKNSHRTLQQTFMRDIICQFIETEASNSNFDDRNKQTHDLCVKLNNCMNNESNKIYLPFI